QARSHEGRLFMSLRTKFVLFISLIIITTCSSLSWYFIRSHTDSMTSQVFGRGSILVKNLAYNSRSGVFTEDQVILNQYIEGVRRPPSHSPRRTGSYRSE